MYPKLDHFDVIVVKYVTCFHPCDPVGGGGEEGSKSRPQRSITADIISVWVSRLVDWPSCSSTIQARPHSFTSSSTSHFLNVLCFVVIYKLLSFNFFHSWIYDVGKKGLTGKQDSEKRFTKFGFRRPGDVSHVNVVSVFKLWRGWWGSYFKLLGKGGERVAKNIWNTLLSRHPCTHVSFASLISSVYFVAYI